MTPTISVVIPCRDRPRLLHRALASLERQTFHDFETLVVDDGSVEDVRAVATTFARLRVRMLEAGGRGANHARNVGTDAALGRYVAYLDSDDAFLPERLARAARRIGAGTPDLLASAGYVWRRGGRLQTKPRRPPAPGEDISEFYFAAGERFLTSGLLVRTSVARAVRWDERLRKVQDPDFVIRLVRAGHGLDYSPDPDVILFDNVQSGRISDAVTLDNLRDWLDRSGPLLTPKARSSFTAYALAYEAARTSRLRGLRVLASAAHAAPFRVTAKSLYRLLVPVAAFKATAQLALSQSAPPSDALARYIAALEAPG